MRDQNVLRQLTSTYLAGFLISLIVGYIFYIGFYTGMISFETIDRFSVEAQIGWGFLRFSPGTYPNEYGNIASFALSLLLLRYGERKRFLTFVFAGLTWVALLLTTTRAAYLSFLVTLIYLCITSPAIRKMALKWCTFSLVVLLILKAYFIDFFHIFEGGVRAISLTSGSTGIRFAEWVKGFQNLNENLLLGHGFGSSITAHNIYLELLFELGLVGILLLIVTAVYYLGNLGPRLRKPFSEPVIMVGLIHVFLFALTNHNMHHHLTWFVFLIFNKILFQQSDAGLSLRKQSPSPLPLQQQDPLLQR